MPGQEDSRELSFSKRDIYCPFLTPSFHAQYITLTAPILSPSNFEQICQKQVKPCLLNLPSVFRCSMQNTFDRPPPFSLKFQATFVWKQVHPKPCLSKHSLPSVFRQENLPSQERHCCSLSFSNSQFPCTILLTASSPSRSNFKQLLSKASPPQTVPFETQFAKCV